jgi:hypothetical protein
MSQKLPFVEPVLTEEASLTEITLVSGDTTGCTVNCPG